MRVRIQFRTLCSRTARHEIAVLLTLVLLPITVQALDDWQPLPTGEMDPRTAEERKAIGKVGKYMANEAPGANVLGEAQWRWLADQLHQPAEVRLVVSSTQIVPDQKGMDEWGVFPRERERLFRLIRDTDAKGVVLLSGNVHFAELSVWKDGPYPIYELTSSGMTHVEAAYAAADNRYRVAGPFVESNFGLVEIDWGAEPGPVITLKAMGEDGRVGFVHFSLGDLQ